MYRTRKQFYSGGTVFGEVHGCSLWVEDLKKMLDKVPPHTEVVFSFPSKTKYAQNERLINKEDKNPTILDGQYWAINYATEQRVHGGNVTENYLEFICLTSVQDFNKSS